MLNKILPSIVKYISRYFICIKSTVLIILMFVVLTSNAQQNSKTDNLNIEVRGLVRDAHTKEPLNAVQINVVNKKSSAVSDENGNFSIYVSSLADVLHLSVYDYNPLEVPLKGRDTITVDLYTDHFAAYFKNIEGGFGAVPNSLLSYSHKEIDVSEHLIALSPDEMLYSLGGDVRTMSKSGLWGMGSTSFIRGINSLNANAQPLFVVDGVIWNNFYDAESVHNNCFSNILTSIDANDIESITVLKDGLALYGSKGANGVILIKTKRGASMVTKIDLNIFTGFKMAPSGFPMMNGNQFRIYASELLKSQGIAPNDVTKFDFLETDPENKMIYNMYHNNTNWENEIYQTGFTQNYNINVSGGDEKALYYFSLGYAGNEDVVKTIDFSRLNARFNADVNMTDNFSVGLNVAYTQVDRTMIDDGVSPFSVSWISKIKSPFLSPYSYTDTGEKSLDYAYVDSFSVANPSAILEFDEVNGNSARRFNLGVNPVYRISPELSVSTLFDYSLYKMSERRFIPMYYTPLIYIPKYKGYSENEINSQVIRNIAFFDDTRISYTKSFNDEHNIKGILGWRYVSNFYESDYIRRHNTGLNSTTTIGTANSANAFWDIKGDNSRTKSISNYINLDYNYDSRYFLSAVVSMDASSRFGRETDGGFSMFGRSWAVFPSITGSWLLSSEKFMKHIDFVNFLKLRAGFELTGNDGIKDYESMAYFSAVRYMDRASGMVLSNIENNKIQWETSARTNIGLDTHLFNNILSLSVDLYSNQISNLLMLRELAEFTGLENYWDNGGTMVNRGLEASFNVKVLNLNNFTWELGAGIGRYKNKITSLPFGNYSMPVYGGEVRMEVGQPAAVFYGYKTKGVFATHDESIAANLSIVNRDGTLSAFTAGDVIFDDFTPDNIIDEKDKQIIGDPTPDFYGTINNQMTYRRFTFNTIFSYTYGNDVYNYQRSLLESGAEFNNQTMAMLNRWTAEGQVTNQPKSFYGDPMGNARFSDRWIEDGSYFRLKTISLSYEVPFKNDYIHGLKVWASANNVFTLTNYLGLDPEFSAGNSVYLQGVDAGFTPLTRSFYLGVKFNL
ncbi:MAG: SusC/RagA family TonB-linked outer membrane protein [Bacteroidales bacterium]|nr:SusC/RagA family TonB-linked outer membrane protein [Bacteroidales bacterium]